VEKHFQEQGQVLSCKLFSQAVSLEHFVVLVTAIAKENQFLCSSSKEMSSFTFLEQYTFQGF